MVRPGLQESGGAERLGRRLTSFTMSPEKER